MTARILVVDDIPANVRLLEAKLTAEYFEVLTANDGFSALEAAQTQAPDLILLDVMMPGMDGFEVAKRLKTDTKTRHIPIVMITALTDTTDRVRGLEAGADDFLSKPVNDIALFARVRSLTRLKVMIDELRMRHATTGPLDITGETLLDTEDDARNGRILLVESEELLAAKMTEHLSEAGHDIFRATGAAEALERGREQDLDLIIVGLDLAGEDGLRLCSQYRLQDQTRHVPILLTLEEGDLERLAKGLELGVTDYLIRPIDQNELLARTRTQIRRRRYHDKLREMLDKSVSLAYTDALTGIYNRRYMNAHLDRKIMEISDTQKPVSVLIFDIDHFKRVNDTYGHAAGDDVLKMVAERVGDGIRDFDLLARYGGEEFVVIMPNTPAGLAAMVAERLRQGLAAQPFEIAGSDRALPITASLGVATTTDPMETAQNLLGRADVALYAAKNAGRNRVRSADVAEDDVPEDGEASAEPMNAVAGG
ncbi:MAG: PleD family two-component system response regulator [Proteobacteria bacterium]|nr:PleD family two-component system response regulator [Pseudomonadota bacterium]